MKLLGGKWSKGDLIALFGLLVAIISIPGVLERFQNMIRRQKEGEAEFKQAVAHMQGWAKPETDVQGIQRLHESAAMGYAPAQYLVGILAPQDDAVEFTTWMRKAAEQGFVPAEYEMGEVPGMDWLSKAAEQGYPPAERDLGDQYIGEDSGKALDLLRRAAAQHDSQADWILGKVYEDGEGGVPKSIPDAITWYTEGTNEGDHQAMYALGQLYASQHDYAEMYKWYWLGQYFSPSWDHASSSAVSYWDTGNTLGPEKGAALERIDLWQRQHPDLRRPDDPAVRNFADSVKTALFWSARIRPH